MSGSNLLTIAKRAIHLVPLAASFAHEVETKLIILGAFQPPLFIWKNPEDSVRGQP